MSRTYRYWNKLKVNRPNMHFYHPYKQLKRIHQWWDWVKEEGVPKKDLSRIRRRADSKEIEEIKMEYC